MLYNETVQHFDGINKSNVTLNANVDGHRSEITGRSTRLDRLVRLTRVSKEAFNLLHIELDLKVPLDT